MPIPELVKFRERYPQYNDLDDTTLAESLAKKYPEYQDLPAKVSVIEPKKKPIFKEDIVSPRKSIPDILTATGRKALQISEEVIQPTLKRTVTGKREAGKLSWPDILRDAQKQWREISPGKIPKPSFETIQKHLPRIKPEEVTPEIEKSIIDLETPEILRVAKEFGPEMGGTILEAGTRPETWVTWHAIKTLSPPLLNKLFSKLPKGMRDFLLKERSFVNTKLQDAYKTLGVRSTAPMGEVQKSYRSKVLRLHPDKPTGDAVKFRQVQESYDLIKESRFTPIQKFAEGFRKPTKPTPGVKPLVPIKQPIKVPIVPPYQMAVRTFGTPDFQQHWAKLSSKEQTQFMEELKPPPSQRPLPRRVPKEPKDKIVAVTEELKRSLEKDIQKGIIQPRARREARVRKAQEAVAKKVLKEPIPARKPIISPREPGEPELTKEDIIKRSEIAKMLSEKLNVPIKVGKFREKAYGIFKPVPKIIRVKAPLDIETIAHETGHLLEDTLKLKKDLPTFRSELMPLTRHFPKRHQKLTEGFAEFLRTYITNPTEAQARLPNFWNYWEKVMNQNPEIRDVLLQARKDYDRWLKLPATARVMSQISPTPTPIGKGLQETIERLYTLGIDELYPLKKYTEIIKEKGIKILEENDPFILASQHRGWHGKADTYFHHKTFDTNFNWTGTPLNEIYKDIGELNALEEFDTYLIARRTLDLARRPGKQIKTGVRLVDAGVVVAELERKYPIFREKSQELHEYQNKLLEYARDSELISNEAFIKIRELNKFYVPLHRVMEVAKTQGMLGKGVVNLPQVIKKIKGSEREIISPSESIVKNTYTILDAAERNQIALALVRLAQVHPEELGRIVEKVPPPLAKVAKLSLDEIRKQLLKDGVIDISDELTNSIIDIFRPSIFGSKDNVIAVMQKGKKTFYEVDPDIYRSLTAIDRESTNFLIKMLSYPARWLRLGAVALSPEFLVRNPLRDAFTAFVYSKAGFIPGLDTWRGLYSVFKQDEMYWRWKISGGEHSMLVSLDREYLQKNIRDLIKTFSGRVKNVAKHPLEHARILAELGEEATRIGEFKLVMGGGKRWALMAEKIPEGTPLKSRILKAGNASREVTLDFARLGAKTKAVNQIIAFWNANVQDLDKIRRSFQSNPIRSFYKVFLGITIPSVLLWLAQHDDERYQELPQWQKDLFWIVLTEKNIYRIPKPFTMGILFGSVPEAILSYIENQDPVVFKNVKTSLLKSTNPGFLPTAFSPPIENMTNYSFFLDRPIVPLSLQKLPPELQQSVYTTESAKLIGSALNISPLKVENFVRGYTGGLGRLGFETVDQILRSLKDDIPQKPKATLADVPIIRGFVAREPVGSASESVNRFYELYEVAQQGEAAIKEMQREGNYEAADKYRTQYPEYRYASYLRAIARNLANLRKQRTRIWEGDLTPEQKRDEILRVEQEMTIKARHAIGIVRR